LPSESRPHALFVVAPQFYRGSNQLFYRDMANQNIVSSTGSSFYSATATPWIGGDMHALNAVRRAAPLQPKSEMAACVDKPPVRTYLCITWLRASVLTERADMDLVQGTFDLDTTQVVYDLNDFDEAFVANFLYDIYRMAASIVLVGRASSMVAADSYSAVRSFVNFYCDRMVKIVAGEHLFSTARDAHMAGFLCRPCLLPAVARGRRGRSWRVRSVM
jgi:hypothetical protein